MNNKEEINYILPFLSGQAGLNIIDIGCGQEAYLLSNIFNSLTTRITKLIGVDNYNAEDDEVDDIGFINNHNSCHENKRMTNGVAEIINQEGFSYLNDVIIPQHLIIFSNVLHFYSSNRQMEVMQNAITKLTSDGIIYIKIANEFHTYQNRANRFPINENEIERIRSFAKIEAIRKTKIHYELIIRPIKKLCSA